MPRAVILVSQLINKLERHVQPWAPKALRLFSNMDCSAMRPSIWKSIRKPIGVNPPLSPSSKYSHRCFMSLWRRDCLLMESELPNKVQRVFDGALATWACLKVAGWSNFHRDRCHYLKWCVSRTRCDGLLIFRCGRTKPITGKHFREWNAVYRC